MNINQSASWNQAVQYLSTFFTPSVNENSKPTKSTIVPKSREKSIIRSHFLNIDFNLEYGIEPTSRQEYEKCIETFNSWFDLDVENLNKVSQGNPLVAIAWYIIRELKFIETFDFNPVELLRFLYHIENKYNKDTPYHNNLHAADVTHSVYNLLKIPEIYNNLTDVDKFALIISAVCHDVDHTGFTNMFLVKTTHQHALCYNDRSVQENHHSALAFELMQVEGLDTIVQSLQNINEWSYFRDTVIEIILGTDMSLHGEHMEALESMVDECDMCSHKTRIDVMKSIM